MTPQQTKLASFSKGFMMAYAGKVMSSPVAAITEQIANSWDAAARNINITWPEKLGEKIEISDNGHGMTYDEFMDIWPTASYSRSANQGDEVILDDGTKRKTYGRNGIGRFGMFYFSDTYEVETWKDGLCSKFEVKITGSKDSPYSITPIDSYDKDGHGTTIGCNWDNTSSALVLAENVSNIIKSRFMKTHGFTVSINGKEIAFNDFKSVSDEEFTLSNGETIIVRRCKIEHRSQKSGIIWRVKGRPIGDISWKGLKYRFDERKDMVRDYFLVVEADPMETHTEPDWSAFKTDEASKKVMDEILSFVEISIKDIVLHIKSNRKAKAVKENLKAIKGMSSINQENLGVAMQEILDRCPTMSGNDLVNVVSVLVTMEGSKNKYSLMEIMSNADSYSVDQLTDIMSKWSIQEMKVVFNELEWRIDTVRKLRSLINSLDTLEVAHLQPIFERSLWIFGPEYDTCSFTSNEAISTVFMNMIGKKIKAKEYSKRPDFVVTPDSSLGFYSADRYDYNYSGGESRGYSRILILELKKGGSKISSKELNQAMDYARILIKSHHILGDPEYFCYILGSEVEEGLIEPLKQGKVVAFCIPYDVILNTAEARLLGLIGKMKAANEGIDAGDKDISRIINETPTLDIDTNAIGSSNDSGTLANSEDEEGIL
ncbi:MAG TPA: ATP-binding protein [Methanocorpusculum sp.]|nr:ATP-binding protein [Methanocorpusculum sp.]